MALAVNGGAMEEVSQLSLTPFLSLVIDDNRFQLLAPSWS